MGERLQKLVIDAGFTCPNRDGTVGVGGCSYCDNAAFHPGYSTPGKSIAEQIDEGIAFYRHHHRYPSRLHRYGKTRLVVLAAIRFIRLGHRASVPAREH